MNAWKRKRILQACEIIHRGEMEAVCPYSCCALESGPSGRATGRGSDLADE